MVLSFPGSRPWIRVGTDLFEIERKTYRIVADYTLLVRD